MKKRTIPTKTVVRIGDMKESFKACGISPNKAAESRTPVAYEIRPGIRVSWILFGNISSIAAVIIAPILPKTLKNRIQIIKNLAFSHYKIKSRKKYLKMISNFLCF